MSEETGVNLSYQGDKFRKFRSKRYINPQPKCVSLDCCKNYENIENTFKIANMKQTPYFKLESYHHIAPKKISLKIENPHINIKRPKITLHNNSHSSINPNNFSFSKNSSTQDTTIHAISSINRSNANYYYNPKVYFGIKRNSVSVKDEKNEQIKENIWKSEVIIENNDEKHEKLLKNEKIGGATELLISKIKSVFHNFKEKHEDILTNYNNGRRKRLNMMLKCPKITEI